MDKKVLIVDDEEIILEMTRNGFFDPDFSVHTADNVEKAIDMISAENFDVIVTDKNMTGLSFESEGGMDVLKFAKKHNPLIELIMMTGFASVDNVIDAMRLGASDYITKPFDLEELQIRIERALRYKMVLTEVDKQSEILERGKIKMNDILKKRGEKVTELSDKIDSIFEYVDSLKSKSEKDSSEYILLNRIQKIIGAPKLR